MNSKEYKTKMARRPKCTRCRNHGFTAELKGHAGKCPFVQCACWKCALITERRNITAKHRRTKTAPTAAVSPVGAAGNVHEHEVALPAGDSRAPTDSPSRISDNGHCALSHGRTVSRDPGHFPWEYIQREMPQNVYSGKTLAMAVPFQMFPHPDSCVYPAFLMSLQPPFPGTLREPISYSYPPPGVLAFSADPVLLQESPLSFDASYPPYPWVRDGCSAIPPHYPLSHSGNVNYHLSPRENDSGAEGSASQFGSDSGMGQHQGSDIIIVDSDFSSKDSD
ncbi:doublesex- and mab-3-related transcription factor C2-like isoform X2 [Hoplias malabaricus]|uniref:doublesex- and mab-3-related transcription factor C2-like isoform X2 n=1 Tax=Hoplias malabaricus TaxID=27720 RepID=UPI003462A857